MYSITWSKQMPSWYPNMPTLLTDGRIIESVRTSLQSSCIRDRFHSILPTYEIPQWSFWEVLLLCSSQSSLVSIVRIHVRPAHILKLSDYQFSQICECLCPWIKSQVSLDYHIVHLLWVCYVWSCSCSMLPADGWLCKLTWQRCLHPNLLVTKFM